MDLTEGEALPEMSDHSAECQRRFRYQLWSQAAQDFRSRPAAPQRFALSGRNRAAIKQNARTSERHDASESETTSGPDKAR